MLGLKLIHVHSLRPSDACVSKQTIIGSDSGLSPGRRQAIIWTNDVILLIEPLGTNFSKLLIDIYTFPFSKMHLKMSSGKWRPLCPGLSVHGKGPRKQQQQQQQQQLQQQQQQQQQLRKPMKISCELCGTCYTENGLNWIISLFTWFVIKTHIKLTYRPDCFMDQTCCAIWLALRGNSKVAFRVSI